MTKPKAGVAQRQSKGSVTSRSGVRSSPPAPVSESKIVADIRLSLGARTDCIVWRNSTGVAKTRTGHTVRFGLCVGSSDLIAIVKPSGRMVVLEAKTPIGRATKEQIAFIEMVRAAGGHGAIVRSVEEANRVIDEAISR